MQNTMNPSINTIPTAQLYGSYTLWSPVEETWSEPITFTDAMSAYARDPELQAAILNQDGTAGDPVPFAEIAKRAHTASTLPRDLETSIELRQRNIRVQNQRAAATRSTESVLDTPITLPHPAAPSHSTQEAPIPPETLALLTHALRLFIIVTYGTFYLTGAAALIAGAANEQKPLIATGIIILAITAAVNCSLAGRND